MNIKINTSTIRPMLDICEKYIAGENIEEELRGILNHEDYLVELERYNASGGPRGGFSKEEFIDFLTNLNSLNYTDINNIRLRERLASFQYLLKNIDKYKALMPLIESISVEKVRAALEKTKKGLPEDIDFNEIELIFSIGLGPSLGWFYNNYSHYDVIEFFKDFNEEILLSTIAHEYHHVGYRILSSNLDESAFTIEETFYSLFSGEGLAIKYCNNYKGLLTTNIYNERANIGVDEKSYAYFMEEFKAIYEKFLSDIQDIRSGKFKTQEELVQMFIKYWMGTRTNRVKDNEPDDLGQSLSYFVGAEIWGLIHDTYGKEKLYEILKNPSLFLSYYNKALSNIGRNDLLIPEV